MLENLTYEQLLETCSEEVKMGIEFIEDYFTFREERLIKKLEETSDRWLRMRILKERERILKAGYMCSDAELMYVLSKVKHPLVNSFKQAATLPDFWLEDGSYDLALFDCPYLLWYLLKLGIGPENEFFRDAVEVSIKSVQTVKGEIHSNEIYHVGPMRVLIALEPQSKQTMMAVNFFIENLEDLKNYYPEWEAICILAIGGLGLWDLDYHKYRAIIDEICEFLKQKQHDEGFWGSPKDSLAFIYEPTCYSVELLVRHLGPGDPSVRKAVLWLKNQQDEDGSWLNKPQATAYALSALISAGEGPKVPIEHVSIKEELGKQLTQRIKPQFVCTYPGPQEIVTEIKTTLKNAIRNAMRRIWICTRFITEFFTDIIDVRKERPDIDVKIVVIPRGEASKTYKGPGKKFLDPAFEILRRELGADFKVNPLLHARLYIIDDQVLISSADMTPEQLEKEFNVGIWTKDPDVVRKSELFFKRIWESSEFPH